MFIAIMTGMRTNMKQAASPVNCASAHSKLNGYYCSSIMRQRRDTVMSGDVPSEKCRPARRYQTLANMSQTDIMFSAPKYRTELAQQAYAMAQRRMYAQRAGSSTSFEALRV